MINMCNITKVWLYWVKLYQIKFLRNYVFKIYDSKYMINYCFLLNFLNYIILKKYVTGPDHIKIVKKLIDK